MQPAVSCSKICLSKPNSHVWNCSWFTVVSGGLVYWLVLLGELRTISMSDCKEPRVAPTGGCCKGRRTPRLTSVRTLLCQDNRQRFAREWLRKIVPLG